MVPLSFGCSLKSIPFCSPVLSKQGMQKLMSEAVHGEICVWFFTIVEVKHTEARFIERQHIDYCYDSYTRIR